MEEDLKKRILDIQRNEITESLVYKKLSSIVKNQQHSDILNRISNEEIKHYKYFKGLTNEEVSPNNIKIVMYVFISRLLGLNFGLKLMENGENKAQASYKELKEISPLIDEVLGDEKAHEKAIIDLIQEERLKYVSSIVLGLNDALVELSGALVGFTLALQNTRLVGIVGLITGIAASMSMASSEYLSTKHENEGKNPLRASIYTGIAYVGTVILLTIPYFFISNIYFCLGIVIANVLLVILAFNYYISVAKNLSFKKRFIEMAGISIGIAAINFVIGLIIRKVFGIEV